MRLTLIVAVDLDDCIGKSGDIPWYLPSDLRRFKEMTVGRACIMGSKTHDSIVARLGNPLPDRRSYVISREKRGGFDGGMYVESPDSALLQISQALTAGDDGEAFVIGGAQIYEAMLPKTTRILLTRVHTRVHGDTFMPINWLGGFVQIESWQAVPDPKDEFASSYTHYERFERTFNG